MSNRIFIVETVYAKNFATRLMSVNYFQEIVHPQNIHQGDNLISGYRNGCVVGIMLNDNRQPHFHLIVADEAIAFSIETGRRLKGETGFEQLDDYVHLYWELDRIQIAECWNEARPQNQYTIPQNWSQNLSDREEEKKGVAQLINAEIPMNEGNNVPRA